MTRAPYPWRELLRALSTAVAALAACAAIVQTPHAEPAAADMHQALLDLTEDAALTLGLPAGWER